MRTERILFYRCSVTHCTYHYAIIIDSKKHITAKQTANNFLTFYDKSGIVTTDFI